MSCESLGLTGDIEKDITTLVLSLIAIKTIIKTLGDTRHCLEHKTTNQWMVSNFFSDLNTRKLCL